MNDYPYVGGRKIASESRQSFGKRQEFASIAEMLKQGLDVYMTLVDDKGIDCIVRKDTKTYYDVQIKARGKDAKYPGNFRLSDIIARPNYFFVFYAEKPDKFWVIPSERITGSDGGRPLGCQVQDGNTKGEWHIDLWWSGITGSEYEEFKKYENAWYYLGVEKDL
jgi:hypothetical protein